MRIFERLDAAKVFKEHDCNGFLFVLLTLTRTQGQVCSLFGVILFSAKRGLAPLLAARTVLLDENRKKETSGPFLCHGLYPSLSLALYVLTRHVVHFFFHPSRTLCLCRLLHRFYFVRHRA